MESDVMMKLRELKPYAIISLAYLLLTLLMFWPIMLNITSVVPGVDGGTFKSMWELWWVPYSLFTLHSSPYFSHYIFYPVGANLAAQALAPIAGLVSMLFQPAGLAFALNIIFIIGFVLSGLFAYILAFHVTKHRWASFIAGVIYAFSPIHTMQAFGHLQFINIEFIPLFLFLFLKMVEERKHAYALGAAISFVLLTFMGDVEQGLVAILLLFFTLAYFCLTKESRQKLLDKRFMLTFGEMLIAILVLSSPFIFGILSALTLGTLQALSAQTTTFYNELYSPDVLSFLLPSQFNGLLSFASSGFSGIITPAAYERTTYVGYSVILLVLIALVYEYKERFKGSGLFLVLLVFFGLVSIGPYLQINGRATQIPGLYLLYHQIPVFNILSEPGRFDIPLELFLAIFAAIGITKLEKINLLSSMKRYIPLLFLALIIIEYNSWPISESMLQSSYTLNATIPTPYYELGRLTGNFSVLVLPALSNYTLSNYTSSKPNLYPDMALYYQTAFKHPLVGGYATRTNVTQTFSLVNIPLAVSAYYLEEGQGLVYGSPIEENYSNATSFLLDAYNVGFVSVIRQAYNTSELEQLASYLVSFLNYSNVVFESNQSIVFNTDALTSKAGTVLSEYTPVLFYSSSSVWQPGWLLCGSSNACSEEYLSSYFGVNPAYINIYSPNTTRLNISFRALAPFGVKPVRLYFNDQLLSILNLTPNLQNFSISAVAARGINSLFFLSANGTQGSYSNIGISNLAFKKYA